jgi:fucose 4-O-acetylase-like acetyltransferase
VGQIWFLVCLFFVEILAYILFHLIVKRSLYASIVLILCIAVFGFYVRPLVDIPFFTRLPWKLDAAMPALAFFLSGYVIKTQGVLDKIKPYAACLLPLLLVANFVFGTILNGYVNISELIFGNPLYYYCAAFAGSGAILLFAMRLGQSRALEYYGRNTLPMFAVHSLLLYFSAWAVSVQLGEPVEIMRNIPTSYCFALSVAVYMALYPVSKIYNGLIALFLHRPMAKAERERERETGSNTVDGMEK